MTGVPLGSRSRRLAALRGAAVALDVLIVLFAVVLIVIVVTGGGVLHAGGLRIRTRSADNPLWILTALTLIRYALERGLTERGGRTWFGETIDRGTTIAAALPSTLDRWFTAPAVGLGIAAAATLVLKVLIAWNSPGFFSGDDVEVQEMSIGTLLGMRWPVWQLRSSFFPLTFVYPAQLLAHSAGASSPDVLVFAGRASVALFSTAVLPLTWLAARRLVPGQPQIAALSVVFVAVNKLFISFGSSELPRPVSSAFVVAAFAVLLRPGLAGAVAAGLLLGAAIAFRFSEVVFVAAAVIPLLLSREWTRAAAAAMAAIVCAAAITAVADQLYWGSPLSSIAAAVDYTVIEGRSSRGYEPAWEYLQIVPAWSTPMIVALAIAGSSRFHPDSWWLWTPVVLLSLLPHKEGRYLIPIVPFLAISAARGALRALHWAQGPHVRGGARRWTLDLFAPLLALSLLHDAGGWRLRRANEGIELARHLRRAGGSGIAAEDFWTLGGRPYLWQQEPLLTLDSHLLRGDALGAAVAGMRWVALHPRTVTSDLEARMGALGFARDPSWRGEDYVLFARRQ